MRKKKEEKINTQNQQTAIETKVVVFHRPKHRAFVIILIRCGKLTQIQGDITEPQLKSGLKPTVKLPKSIRKKVD